MQSAAKALGVNQSTVQRRIIELEKCVGQRLVERHLGSYRLTELGEQLLPAAEGVEAAVASFDRHLAACDKGLTGTVVTFDTGSTGKLHDVRVESTRVMMG
jgi:DNA-binding transcriptional LysR family regulator